MITHVTQRLHDDVPGLIVLTTVLSPTDARCVYNHMIASPAPYGLHDWGPTLACMVDSGDRLYPDTEIDVTINELRVFVFNDEFDRTIAIDALNRTVHIATGR